MSPAAEPPDSELAARAVAGDERAFTRLMQRHKDGLYRFIRRYTGEADEAYDLLQESFTAAWSALRRYDRTRSFPTWLRRIALNKCRDWSRRRAVRRWLTRNEGLDGPVGQALADSGPSPESALDEHDRLACLDQAIARLPAGLKGPLILTTLEGLSHAEAGLLLGLSAKAVEVRVYRARRALSEQLGLTDSA